MGKNDINKMLNINKMQASYYDDKPKNRNMATTVWWYFREKVLGKYRKLSGINDDVIQTHKNWLGDLSDKRVLDLGCFGGNLLSLYIAQNAHEYVAIDLSKKGIDILKNKLKNNNLESQNIKAKAVDFLSNEFNEPPFDIIYIFSAMHHFQYFDVLLDRLDLFLKPKGIIISYDPLETNWMIYLLRRLYRPFQSDSKWEWPFNKRTLKKIENKFDILKIQGYLGRSKWSFIIGMLPISDKTKLSIAKKFHAYDLKYANKIGYELYSCLHVSMVLKKK